MANGQQKSDENLEIFQSWIASKNDLDFRDLTIRGQLNRQDIAEECNFSRSVLLQNPRIKEGLLGLEKDLRQRGILPPIADPSDTSPQISPAGQSRSVTEQARLKRLEAENASLRAEVLKLRADNIKYIVMQSVLLESGRLPR